MNGTLIEPEVKEISVFSLKKKESHINFIIFVNKNERIYTLSELQSRLSFEKLKQPELDRNELKPKSKPIRNRNFIVDLILTHPATKQLPSTRNAGRVRVKLGHHPKLS